MKTAFALLATLALALALAGCGTLGLSAEQISAMKDVSSSVCIDAPGWNGAPVKVHYVSFGGKATGTAGGGGEAACGTSIAKFNNEGRLETGPSGIKLPPNSTIAPGPTPGSFIVTPK